MSFLFVGDIHLTVHNADAVDILEEKVIHFLSYSPMMVNAIVLAGDVLHTHEKIMSPLMNRAYRLIRRWSEKCQVIVLVGNHDYINNQQFLSDRHWMNGMKTWHNVLVVDEAPLVWKKDVVMLPYIPPGRLFEAISRLPLPAKEYKVFVGHQEIKGCRMGAIVSQDGDVWPSDYPVFISGHIHERHKPQDNVWYPGSALNHAAGHDDQGCYAFGRRLGEIIEVEKIELNLPQKKSLRLELNEGNVSSFFPSPKDLHIRYHNLTVCATPSQWKTFRESVACRQWETLTRNIKWKKKLDDVSYVKLKPREDFSCIFHRLLSLHPHATRLTKMVQPFLVAR